MNLFVSHSYLKTTRAFRNTDEENNRQVMSSRHCGLRWEKIVDNSTLPVYEQIKYAREQRGEHFPTAGILQNNFDRQM